MIPEYSGEYTNKRPFEDVAGSEKNKKTAARGVRAHKIFPAEIWTKIFSFLPSQDFFSLRASCRLFRDVSYDILKDRAKSLFFETRKFDKVNKVYLDEKKNIPIGRYLHYLKSIEELKHVILANPVFAVVNGNFYPLKRWLSYDPQNKPVVDIDKALKEVILSGESDAFVDILMAQERYCRPNKKLRHCINNVYLSARILYIKPEAISEIDTLNLAWALSSSASKGFIGIAKRVRKLGAEINKPLSYFGYNIGAHDSFPLDFSIAKGNIQGMKYLLKKGADPSLRLGEDIYIPPLQALLAHVDWRKMGPSEKDDFLEIMKVFLKKAGEPYDVLCRLFFPASSISFACFKCLYETMSARSEDLIRLLDEKGNSLLHTAVGFKMTKLLLDLGLDVNLCNNAQETPLISAIKNLDLEKAVLLIKAPHVNASAKDKVGKTAFDYAIRHELLFSEFIKEYTSKIVDSFLI